MLNQKDLAAIRAALMFLDEEFFPDQEEMFQHYLDDQGVLAGTGIADIPVTRAKLKDVELYSALKWSDRAELVSTQLIRSLSGDDFAYQADQHLAVAVIAPGQV